jgi:hypothetical protein
MRVALRHPHTPSFTLGPNPITASRVQTPSLLTKPLHDACALGPCGHAAPTHRKATACVAESLGFVSGETSQ